MVDRRGAGLVCTSCHTIPPDRRGSIGLLIKSAFSPCAPKRAFPEWVLAALTSSVYGKEYSEPLCFLGPCGRPFEQPTGYPLGFFLF